jgi:alanine racemase
MDQTMFVVGDAEVGLGDEVVLLGSQNGTSISADDWATDVGTVSYEIVCSVGPRVPRRYLS